ncbi:TBC1D23_4 [Blepharisma stoltei]|uniref:Rab-GAP TBC domain-containing protein n=1 Tax=Blepharisma stoltei TaxID=1481888 RepID=A0AAU9IBZ9_9CILI|nr:unnamed protein product [Blepharisma stoltei]
MDTPNRIFKWTTILLDGEVEDFPLLCRLDLPNQDVIKVDSERTRMRLINKQEKDLIELLLTYFCKETNINYKQGMNEVLAPFLLFFRDGLSLSKVYRLYHNFVAKFLENMFSDDEFVILESYFVLFKLLLRYYDPELGLFLDDNKIGPELYATPWFITLFASKIADVEVLYELWEKYMNENDKLFFLFVALALMIKSRNSILRSDPSLVCQHLTELTFKNLEVIEYVLELSKNLKKNLPYSLYISLYKPSNLSIDAFIAQQYSKFCLKLSPRELILKCYPLSSACLCSGKCLWCSKSKSENRLLIFDCRKADEQRYGVIPNTISLNTQFFYDMESLRDFPDRYLPFKGKVHIVLLGNEDLKFKEYRNKGSLKGEVYDLKNIEENTEDKFILSLYIAFSEKKFPYVSVVDGGFYACHNLIVKQGLKLINHGPDTCIYCNPKLQDLPKEPPNIISGLKNVFSSVKKYFKKLGSDKNPKTTPGPSTVIVKKNLEKWKSDDSVCFFICKQYENPKNLENAENCIIIITRSKFLVSTPFSDISSSSDMAVGNIKAKVRVKDFMKAAKKRNLQTAITFYFKGKKLITLSFLFKSAIEAKACLVQLRAHFNRLREMSLIAT